MTETNSPTNLTADLESSVERTNTTTNSNEIQTELPSAIRSDESNSFSPIMENYNSPTAPLTADTDDATARLLRIRDELTQQVRERDNAARQLEIQKEIDELQNSLDRRHRRESDHYADLTYNERFPNYDVPQALTTNSTTSTSAVIQEQPLLPPLPPIPVKMSKESIGLIDFKHVTTLDGKISPELAEKFFQQSRQAEFNLNWQQCIQENSLNFIRMRVKTSFKELQMTEEAAYKWDPQLLDHLQMAALVYKLFGNVTTTATPVQINNAIGNFNFGWKLSDREVEEESYANICKLITDHYGPIETIAAETQQAIALMIYRKLPAHSEISKLYSDKVKLDKEDYGFDTITRALDRYLSVIQTVRNLTERALAFRIPNDEFYSGPTVEKASKDSSTNKVISYGKDSQRCREIKPLPKVTNTDYGEMMRTSNSRCETCGRTNHKRETCRLHGHPYANNTSTKWHFSKLGRAWLNQGLSVWTVGTHLKGYGVANYDPKNRAPPHNYVYPNEQGTNHPTNYKEPQPKVNAWYANHRQEQDNLRNQQSNNYNRDYNNNQYNSNNNNNNQDNKRPRSEYKQYVFALLNSVRNKLLPVRIYLTPQGTITTEDGTTDKHAADLATITGKTAIRPMMPQPGLPETANPATRLTTNGRDRLAPTPTVARARVVKTEALLDSGSLAGDFINAETLRILNGSHHLRSAEETIIVCSGLDNKCLESNVVLDITIEFDVGDITHSISIPVRMSNDSPLGCILGIDTIKKYNIGLLVPHFFLSEEAIAILRSHLDLRDKRKIQKTITEEPHTSTPNELYRTNRCPTECRECTSDGEQTLPDIVIPVCDTAHPTTNAPKQPVARSVHFDDTPLEIPSGLITPTVTEFAPAQTPRPVAALIREVEQLPEVDEFGDEGIDYDKKDMFAPFRSDPKGDTNIDIIDKITICGTPEQQTRIRALCVKYKQIFKDELDSQPANIEPFDLKVDKGKWEQYKNRGPVRPQSTIKNEEINKQVKEMETAGIIEKSRASFYSQVMLTPKPNGTWRFCVDYRAMNDATESASWPIPNITDLLNRLGRAKADTFGVMDLTSGYHQAPLSMACRAFTAFITFAGVYQFTRLPFGPKRAPSYFQEQMATIVLAGMIYIICEMYLDDCIVYGSGTDEFCERLEKLFIRFDEKHIFLKAIKCKLGMSEVEYVGKTVSKDGLRMSEKQIKGVTDFLKPVNNTQMRSFLGFVNYFRNHVPNHSNVVAPLHAMIDHSAKRQQTLSWTPEGTLAFERIKELIAVSPKLYFIHDTAPIVLMTDASDYGVGGYLYQTVANEKQLIALVSKALSPTQLRWSVIQKEAFAIYFCCNQLDRLLRDRKFTIETDHQNLMFIKTDSNPMVVRWWMALQELDFEIKFIAGSENSIADALSRLCINNKIGTPKNIVSALIDTKPISSDHYAAIAQCHNTVVGHSGVDKTVKRLKLIKLKWPDMRTDVWTFIQNCPCCQKMSQIRPPINALKYTTSTYRAMECLNIDFVGPYPDKGYLLVIIDTFTRYVNIYPEPDATAKAAVSGLLKHFGTYGSPKFIRSDNGPHFVNEVIRQFLILVGTSHDRTMAYSSEENALVERCNKEVNRYIRAFTFDKSTQDNYQEHIPFIMRILNTNIVTERK